MADAASLKPAAKGGEFESLIRHHHVTCLRADACRSPLIGRRAQCILAGRILAGLNHARMGNSRRDRVADARAMFGVSSDEELYGLVLGGWRGLDRNADGTML